MHERVKFKGPLVSWLSACLSFTSHNTSNFHPNEKNEIPKSKPESPLSSTRNISETELQKAFVLLIKLSTFFETPGIHSGLACTVLALSQDT